MGKGKGLGRAIKQGVSEVKYVAKKNKPGLHTGNSQTGPALTRVSYKRKGVGVSQEKSSIGGVLKGKTRITTTSARIGRKPKSTEGAAYADRQGPVWSTGTSVRKTKVPGVYKTSASTQSFDDIGVMGSTYHGTVIHPAYPAGIAGAAGGGGAYYYRDRNGKHERVRKPAPRPHNFAKQRPPIHDRP